MTIHTKIIYTITTLCLVASGGICGELGDRVDQNTQAIHDLDVRTDWQNADRLKSMQAMGDIFEAQGRDIREMKQDGKKVVGHLAGMSVLLTTLAEDMKELRVDGDARDKKNREQDQKIAVNEERSVTNRWIITVLISIAAAAGVFTKFFTDRKRVPEQQMIIKPGHSCGWPPNKK